MGAALVMTHDVFIARATTTLRTFAVALQDGTVALFLATTGCKLSAYQAQVDFTLGA